MVWWVAGSKQPPGRLATSRAPVTGLHARHHSRLTSSGPAAARDQHRRRRSCRREKPPSSMASTVDSGVWMRPLRCRRARAGAGMGAVDDGESAPRPTAILAALRPRTCRDTVHLARQHARHAREQHAAPAILHFCSAVCAGLDGELPQPSVIGDTSQRKGRRRGVGHRLVGDGR